MGVYSGSREGGVQEINARHRLSLITTRSSASARPGQFIHSQARGVLPRTSGAEHYRCSAPRHGNEQRAGGDEYVKEEPEDLCPSTSGGCLHVYAEKSGPLAARYLLSGQDKDLK